MKKIKIFSRKKSQGQFLVEILIAIAVTSLVLPALFSGFISSRGGQAQTSQRAQAIALVKEAEEVIRSVREKDWATFATNGVFHPTVSGNSWTFTNGTETINGFTRSLTISDVYRDSNGNIVTTGGTLDPSTKKIDISVTWGTPYLSAANSTVYVTRYINNTVTQQTSQTQFSAGTLSNTQITNTSGGEIALAPNTKGKWCSPTFSSTTISLPDGPPVAVVASASNILTTPNDVFVATSPNTTNSIKLAYYTVPANADPPSPTLRGIFTLDPSRYSNTNFVPTGIGLDNNFKTNAIKYYKSPGGKLYALLATTKPDKEVIAILVNDGDPSNDNTNNGEYQDYVNKIYKYWTFFNTRIYQGNNSATPNQDQSPYGYGSSSLTVFENRGYLTSGGFLYTFDLSNIDTKSTTNSLDMIGCRIELDGYDCNASTSRYRKYTGGNTGTNFSFEQTGLSGCNDGGNVEIYADNDIYPVRVGSNVYIYVAVGSNTNPEFDIANVSSIPNSGTSPSISSSSCGTISNGNSGWKRVSSLDFNSKTYTQEAANSVYATTDGNRAYISSNGGIDANHDGQPDSWQFYILDTSNKSSPKFLSGTSSTGATSGYYYGTGENAELYPRRSLTVFSGSRALLVGKDGVSNTNNALEYQVVDIGNESSPSYCGGVNYNQGFNDLSSVIEADNDKFAYMVSSTGANELKIIQGGPDGSYLDSGTYESTTLDIGKKVAFNRLAANTTLPANTTLTYQIAAADAINNSCNGVTFSYIGPDGTSNTYFPPSGGAIPLITSGNFNNPGRCIRYKAFLTTTNYNVTPQLLDVSINYSQ